jgi:hypothetical protein
VLLDIFNNRISNDFVQSRFFELANSGRGLPYSARLIKADLRDIQRMIDKIQKMADNAAPISEKVLKRGNF